MQTEIYDRIKAAEFGDQVLNSRNEKSVKIHDIAYKIRHINGLITAVHYNKRKPENEHVMIMTIDTFTHNFMYGDISANNRTSEAYKNNMLMCATQYDKNYVDAVIRDKPCYII